MCHLTIGFTPCKQTAIVLYKGLFGVPELSGVDQADDNNGVCAFFMVGRFLILCPQGG
jgi:hypothetical protein